MFWFKHLCIGLFALDIKREISADVIRSYSLLYNHI